MAERPTNAEFDLAERIEERLKVKPSLRPSDNAVIAMAIAEYRRDLLASVKPEVTLTQAEVAQCVEALEVFHDELEGTTRSEDAATALALARKLERPKDPTHDG